MEVCHVAPHCVIHCSDWVQGRLQIRSDVTSRLNIVALAMQVLDRVVGRVGGPKWWSTLSLRAKAQRMHQSRRQGAPVVGRGVCWWQDGQRLMQHMKQLLTRSSRQRSSTLPCHAIAHL